MNKNNKIIININDIENTSVNNLIKNIIEIHRDYRKFKKFENGNLNSFIKLKNNIYKFSKNEIVKCVLNKNFNFNIVLNNNNKIEIILCNYDDFKLWVNGLAFIIKNKKIILNTFH
jgi:hypothetical protein